MSQLTTAEEQEFAWEHSKENIQPSKRGHKLHDVQKDLSESESAECANPLKARLQMQEQVWRDQIKEAAETGNDDPLKLWTRFLRWHDQAHSRGSTKNEKNKVIEDCIEALIDRKQYFNDARFFKRVFKPYVDDNADVALSIFGFLESRLLFQTVAEFYIAWALAAETFERYSEALRIYQLGIDRKAEPRTLLLSRQEQFKIRTIGLVDCSHNQTASASYGYTLAPLDDSDTRTFQVLQQQQSPQAQIIALFEPQVSVQVFDENDPSSVNTQSTPQVVAQSANVPQDDTVHSVAWKHFGRVSLQNKENTMKPQKWNEGNPLPMGKQSIIAEALGDIYEDNEFFGEGANGFTVFDENLVIPDHLTLPIGRNSESLTTPVPCEQKINIETEEKIDAVKDKELTVDNFFTDIFEDATASSDTKNSAKNSSTLQEPQRSKTMQLQQIGAAKHEMQQALTEFYAAHNPEKVLHVPKFLKKFRGKETSIISVLKKKYPAVDLGRIARAVRKLKKLRK